MFSDVGQWISDAISAFGAFGLAALMLLENLFPPIPSEAVLPLAGFFVSLGELNFFAALVAPPRARSPARSFSTSWASAAAVRWS